MKLLCIANTGAELPADFLDDAGGFGRDSAFDVTVGRHYVVYAITLKSGHIWYYLCDDRGLPYPVWYPSALFQVIDGRPSRFWIFVHGSYARAGDILFAYPEWANDALAYYDRLSDREPIAVQTFNRYRQLIDREYLD